MKITLILKVIMLLLSCIRLIKGLRGISSLSSSSSSLSSLSSSSSSSSLIMNIPIHIRGFVDIINMYDIILIDQFGVLHDGKKPLPGAVELLNEIKRKVIFHNHSLIGLFSLSYNFI